MGCRPRLPHLPVYPHLEHLALHSTGQPLEASLNAVSFLHSGRLRRERGRPGGEPAGPRGRLFAKSRDRCQCASCRDLPSPAGGREEEGWVPEAHLPQPCHWARSLAAVRRRQPGGRTGGVLLNTAPPSWGSCFGEVCSLADNRRHSHERPLGSKQTPALPRTPCLTLGGVSPSQPAGGSSCMQASGVCCADRAGGGGQSPAGRWVRGSESPCVILTP